KAGILEMADIYVVNKSDLSGADLMAAEIEQVADRQTINGWTPPVIKASRDDPTGFETLNMAIDAHAAWRADKSDTTATRRARARYQIQALISRRIDEVLEAENNIFLDQNPGDLFDALVERLRRTDEV
ncbi:MAG TPA: hypothetical protein DIT35_02195, partial [Rhodospirillaceae bacterium]|nr:hypothetical protein [Rhodospirillaceae bacterium]